MFFLNDYKILSLLYDRKKIWKWKTKIIGNRNISIYKLYPFYIESVNWRESLAIFTDLSSARLIDLLMCLVTFFLNNLLTCISSFNKVYIIIINIYKFVLIQAKSFSFFFQNCFGLSLHLVISKGVMLLGNHYVFILFISVMFLLDCIH